MALRSADPVTLTEAGAGRYTLSGAIVFATARASHELGCRVIGAAAAASAIGFDCRGLTGADSAGVAVLLDWLAAAREAGKRLRYEGLPESVLAIARISEVDDLLETGV